MSIEDILKNDDPEMAAKTIIDLKDKIKMRNRNIMRQYKRIVNSPEWKHDMNIEKQLKWANRLNKNKSRQKKYLIPEVLYYANKDYWNEAIKDSDFMKKNHSELII